MLSRIALDTGQPGRPLISPGELHWWKEQPLGLLSLALLVLGGGAAIGYVAGGNRIGVLTFPFLTGLGILGLLFPIFLRNISWALIVLVMIFPFLFLSEVTIFGITLFNAVGLLLTGVWLSRVVLLKQPIVYARWMLLLAIALALMVVSSVQAGLTEAVIRSLIKSFSLFTLFFVTIQVIDSEKTLRRVGMAFITSAVLSAGLGILAFIFGWDLRPGDQDLFGLSSGIEGDVSRFHGVVGGPGATGFHMVLGSILILQFMNLFKPPLARYLLSIGLLLLLVQLFLTVSMTSILILTIFAPLGLRGRGTSLVGTMVRLVVVGCMIFGMLYVTLGSFRSRLNEQVESFQVASPGSWGTGRGELWAAGYDTAMDSPWLGFGAGNGYHKMVDHLPPELIASRFSSVRPEQRAIDPHNGYLGVAANFGWVALAVLSIALGIMGRTLYRSLRVEPEETLSKMGMGIALSLLAIALYSLTVDTSGGFQAPLFLGMAMSYVKLVELRRPSSPQKSYSSSRFSGDRHPS